MNERLSQTLSRINVLEAQVLHLVINFFYSGKLHIYYLLILDVCFRSLVLELNKRS